MQDNFFFSTQEQLFYLKLFKTRRVRDSFVVHFVLFFCYVGAVVVVVIVVPDVVVVVVVGDGIFPRAFPFLFHLTRCINIF